MGIVKSILNYLIISGIPVLVIMSLMSFLHIHLGYVLVPFVAISSILLFIKLRRKTLSFRAGI